MANDRAILNTYFFWTAYQFSPILGIRICSSRQTELGTRLFHFFQNWQKEWCLSEALQDSIKEARVSQVGEALYINIKKTFREKYLLNLLHTIGLSAPEKHYIIFSTYYDKHCMLNMPWFYITSFSFDLHCRAIQLILWIIDYTTYISKHACQVIFRVTTYLSKTEVLKLSFLTIC